MILDLQDRKGELLSLKQIQCECLNGRDPRCGIYFRAPLQPGPMLWELAPVGCCSGEMLLLFSFILNTDIDHEEVMLMFALSSIALMMLLYLSTLHDFGGGIASPDDLTKSGLSPVSTRV